MGIPEDMLELKTALNTFANDVSRLDLRHFRLAVTLAHSESAPEVFLTHSCQLFDTDLGDESVSKETARDLLLYHIFLSSKVSLKGLSSEN
jgi:hypothetical protein